MEIKDIIIAIQSNRVRISDHADEEAEADHLTFDEIYFSVKLSAVTRCIAFGHIINRISGLLL